MNVDRPTDTVSLVCIRVKILSVMPTVAESAGTKLPICARNTIKPTYKGGNATVYKLQTSKFGSWYLKGKRKPKEKRKGQRQFWYFPFFICIRGVLVFIQQC